MTGGFSCFRWYGTAYMYPTTSYHRITVRLKS